MDAVRPESNTLTTKLNSFVDHRAHLYTQCSSLDHEMVVLLSQKIGIERDLAKGQDDLVEANRA